jgi:hypothetical protein
MSTAPAASVIQATARNQALYRSLVQEASAGGAGLMGKLVAAARLVLQTQEAAARDLRQRDALAESANQLRQFEQQLCKHYPAALLSAFVDPEAGKKSNNLTVAEVQFDQLELMDDAQVLTSVTLARIQQAAMQVAEASLNELNTLMSSVLGLSAVRADVNPLRPGAYVNALKETLELTQAAAATQLQWCNAMSGALGLELRTLYTGICGRLRKEGVVSVAYSMPSGLMASGTGAGAATSGSATPTSMHPAPAGADEAASATALARPAAIEVRAKDETLLTLDKLRKLLSGELVTAPTGNRVEQFAAQFAQQFEGSAGQPENTDFDATVPAALEALTEMKQVERVVQSLEQRRGAHSTQTAPQEHSVEGQRLAMRRMARDTAQALSLEVVTLMVENIAHDPRMLEPVRQVIRNLEPALLRLALVDPRFFSDKQHPARRLLQDLTHRSLAFESVAASGFEDFLQEVQHALAPLFRAPIESAEVFDQKLSALQQSWSRARKSSQQNQDTAIEVLKHAEARNLLAERIAQGIEAHPDSARVPPVVIDFLCGPWAQVVAQARIKQGAGSAAAEKFEALIPAMLWSAHPVLARSSPSKLTRLVPRLLTTMREGLDTIHYPGTRISVFLEALMAIHQQVFRAGAVASVPAPTVQSMAAATVPERTRQVLEDDPWMAPEEAAASNFVELTPSPEPTPSAEPIAPDMLIVSESAQVTDSNLPLGSWVEILTNEQWVRTQLTWASPHGTLYLFTGVFGSTQSMTRRSRDSLLSSGKLRLISGQPVVDGALDAVAQAAMRNSVDSVL